MQNPNSAEQTVLLEWMEPEIRELDVRETAFRPASGHDGETRYSDCTHS